MLKLLFLVLSPLCLLLFFPSPATAADSDPRNPIHNDHSILLHVKQQLGDPPSLQAWDSYSHPCDWPEINCTEHALLVGLSLRNASISEQIPGRICDLANLIALDISDNSISGGFPDILNCTGLEYLRLFNNSFTGTIPADIDRRLPRLQYLDLSANTFFGDIPSAIGRLSELRFLRLDQNEFNGTWPRKISNLSNLEWLAMGSNEKLLPAILPWEFGALKKLKYLSMERANLIGEIPESFNNLKNLEHLNLALNKLKGKIPERLLMLKNLTYLNLSNNGLSIPEGFCNPQNLTNLSYSLGDGD